MRKEFVLKGVEIELLQKEVIKWRQNKKHPREKTPQLIWSKAAELAKIYGCHKTAKFLKIDPVDLKRAMNATQVVIKTKSFLIPAKKILQ